jgi:Family of unknown function (DUF6085)
VTHDRPSIEDMKALQRKLKKPDYHFIWFDEEGFVMAHTDEERAAGDLESCPLHQRLQAAREMPVGSPGYYMHLPAWDKFARLPVAEWAP